MGLIPFFFDLYLRRAGKNGIVLEDWLDDKLPLMMIIPFQNLKVELYLFETLYILL